MGLHSKFSFQTNCSPNTQLREAPHFLPRVSSAAALISDFTVYVYLENLRVSKILIFKVCIYIFQENGSTKAQKGLS